MPLAKRVIPCLDIHRGRVVKGVKFIQLKDAGDPVACALAYDKGGADELVFLDISASHESRPIVEDVVRRVAATISIPFTVGGGIRSIDDIRNILRAGADKVSLNTAAVEDPDLVQRASERFGSQCIVVAVDAKMTADSWHVFTHGGRRDSGRQAVEWAREVSLNGAGEILLTSMDADGTNSGFDITLTEAVCQAVPIPVIASGGAGRLEHFREVFRRTDCDAALAASVFHYGIVSLDDLKKYLRTYGIPVRH